VPADQPPGQSERQLGGGAEGLAACRTSAVGAVSQATDQFQGPLQGVDAMEAMVADVQHSPAVFAVFALDIEHETVEDRIVGPLGTHDNLSLLLHTSSSSYVASASFLAFVRSVVFYSGRQGQLFKVD